jgi:hypothetical protein
MVRAVIDAAIEAIVPTCLVRLHSPVDLLRGPRKGATARAPAPDSDFPKFAHRKLVRTAVNFLERPSRDCSAWSI